MRAYVVTTGLMFGLLVIAHIARLAVEGPGALRSPIFVIASLLSIGMLVWSILVFQSFDRRPAADSPTAA
jgi:hypothetical protein